MFQYIIGKCLNTGWKQDSIPMCLEGVSAVQPGRGGGGGQVPLFAICPAFHDLRLKLLNDYCIISDNFCQLPLQDYIEFCVIMTTTL